MNKIENWILRHIFRRRVTQGYEHDLRIVELYTMIRESVEKEFNEDNKPTRDSYLTEWFKRSL